MKDAGERESANTAPPEPREGEARMVRKQLWEELPQSGRRRGLRFRGWGGLFNPRPRAGGDSPSRVWTLKQEEVYVMAAEYPTLEAARNSLGRYIELYNTQRPHQALWGFTPCQAHRVGNHSRLLEHLRNLQAQARKERRR